MEQSTSAILLIQIIMAAARLHIIEAARLHIIEAAWQKSEKFKWVCV